MRNFVLLFTITLSFGLNAQQLDTNWVKQYDRTGAYRDAEIVEVDTNHFVIQYGKTYYEIDANGDSLTSGTLDDTLGQFGPNCLVSDGQHFYAGGNSSDGPMVAKLDANYDVVWVTTLKTISFGEGVEALFIDGTDIYASGSHSSSNPFIAKLDASGNMTWIEEFQQSTFSNLTDIIKLKDGQFLASGNLDDYPFVVKFDNAGDTAWTYTEPIFISFSSAAAAELPDSSLLVVCRNTLVELSKDGALTDTTQNLNDYHDVFINEDTVYLFGTRKYTRFGGDNFAYVETRNLSIDSTNAWQFDWMSHSTASNAFQSVVQRSNGGFIAVGRHRDTVNTSANTWNLLAAMFNGTTGSTTPSDTTTTAVRTEEFFGEEVALYPNPANEYLQLNHEGIQSVQVFNSLGKAMDVVYVEQRIETSALPNGLYIIHVETEDHLFRHKAVIRH